MTTTEAQVVRHWGHVSLDRAIRDGLIPMGCSLETVRPEDLAVVDEFHMGGRQATRTWASEWG